MEIEYSYKKIFILKKLIRTILLIIASIMFHFLMGADTLIQTILIWLVYISVAVLFILDSLPGIIHLFKAKYKKIILENLSIYFVITEEEKEVMVEKFNIKEIRFEAFLTKDIIIPAAKPIEEIDDSTYNLPGRKFVVETEDNEEYNIYLELLDDDFVEDFIDWYQGNEVF